MKKENAHMVFYKLFYIIVYTAASFTMASDNLDFPLFSTNNSTVLVIIKFPIVFISVLLALNIVYLKTQDLKFISISSAIISNTGLVLYIIDRNTLMLGGSQFIFSAYWLGYIITTLTSLLIGVSFLYSVTKRGNFEKFIKTFVISVTPIVIYGFYTAFARNPFTYETKSLNLTPFAGTCSLVEAMLDGMRGGIEPFLIFFGNIILFIPYGFILGYYLRGAFKITPLLIGLITPIFIESYQYFFACGNSDIDDVILNFSGFLIGFVFYTIIENKLMIKHRKRIIKKK